MSWRKRAEEAERRALRVAVGLAALVLALFVGMCELAHPAGLSHDRMVIERAAACGVDPYLVRELLHVEDLAGIGGGWRGMVAAKACFESRGNADAVGDGGKAIGVLQLWPWAERTTDRRHPVGSAVAFLGAVLAAMPRTRRACPGVRRVFWLSWVRVNRGPFWRREDRRGEARCSGTDPAGWRLLRRWRRGWR